MNQIIHPITSIKGSIEVPGDKSISHRAVMLGALSLGNTHIHGFLNGEDCLSTIRVFRQLGVEIDRVAETSYIIKGKGLNQLQEPKYVLDVGNSGTTIRLTAGILAGQPFHSVLIGDDSILKRPMKRIKEPLSLMGAKIDGREEGKYAPLSIRGGKLKGIAYHSPVASAQVKSAILFAGLFADQKTTVIEPFQSRDHSENMLLQFGAKLEKTNQEVTIWPSPRLEGQEVNIPGDFSSAAFFIAAALLVPNSLLRIKNIGLNPTRIGFLQAMQQMNGQIEILNLHYEGNESVGDILVKSSNLQGITISGDWIPKIIDELPLFAVVATQAEGITKVTNAEELRVKESDRISTIVNELRQVGVKVEELTDGFVIEGKQRIQGGQVSTHGDHRIGMAMAIAGLIAKEPIIIQQAEAVNISYPQFFEHLRQISTIK
ncbi:3-phosphoshikimate 1-carboxyvinyltransferase [Tepidibacillus infernus]|uniref:3-phosphoshikimate 1-carboxyvinyltransferase n=1 Tax=Tepidibacillus decaturensis TaxID=1413211 RepID=A0A135L3U4_9BACI|nr:3-phosphoshikimate 1-carboxyvinyltransferase [Tepidibacillus decaturensis]KXG43630.1 3-phosphoshikimate 1-carboxyvinyltransferase [Tepidibacillus decaturensis]